MSGIWTSVILTLFASSQDADYKTTRFLGFSKNEVVAAWRTEIRAVRGDNEFRYAVVTLMDSGNGDVLKVLQASSLRQTKGAKLSPGAATQANPIYRDAEGLASWRKISGRGAFRFKALEMDDGAVRLAVDPDLYLEMESDKQAITVEGQRGRALGFRPVARTYDGRLVPLGHFRAAPVPETALHAKVRVYHSLTGYHIAIACRIEPEGAPPQFGRDLVEVVRLPSSPISTVNLNRYHQMKVVWDDTEKLYAEIHPDSYPLLKRWVPGW